MSKLNECLLIKSLRVPESVQQLNLQEWDLLIRQARRADMLPRLYYVLQYCQLLQIVPSQPLCHLESAHQLATAHQRAVRWEVNRIQFALRQLDVPLILLKGAAYVLADLPCAEGRLFSDVDIMVPKSMLDEVENSLTAHGWISVDTDPYDQRYYRQWMHELPPLRHVKRQTTLDVHHSILPDTARWHPEAKMLLESAQPVMGQNELYILSPVDMVLHSATHLFSEGEMEHGLRDLFDLDSLLRHFAEQENDFWESLYERARNLDLSRPMFYALRYTQYLLGTPVPVSLQNAEQGRPAAWLEFVMDRLFERALQPDHASCNGIFTVLARWLLYVRGHYLRMPLYLLIPHLMRKSFRRNKE
jgi:hypothetical protein